MTIAEIAAQMGVTPETLVQEVIAQGTAKATAFVVLGALAIVLAVAVLVVGAYQGSEFLYSDIYDFSAYRYNFAFGCARFDKLENRAGDYGEPVHCRTLWRSTRMKKKKIKNLHVRVSGGVNVSGSAFLVPKILDCIITNDEIGKTLSINDGNVQFTIPFEPLERYLK